jgi:ribosomal subunit interface protein
MHSDALARHMRLSVHARGFDITPEMRALVERHVLRKVSRYADRIRSIVVRLEAVRGGGRPGVVRCSIAITLQERSDSDRISADATNTRMQTAIGRAVGEIGEKLERELSRPGRRQQADVDATSRTSTTSWRASPSWRGPSS